MFVIRTVIAAIALTVAVGLAESPVRVAAQEQAPAFEVASIAPSQVTATTGPASASAFHASPSGIVTFTNYPVRSLIALAYGIEWHAVRYTLEGGPPAVLSARFDIRAKVPPDRPSIPADDAEASVRSTAQLMLRALLAERFGMRAHIETRQLPIFAVTIARPGRLGPELRPSTHDCDAFRAARVKGSTATAPLDAKNRPLCTLEVLRQPAANAGGLRAITAQVERSAGPLARLLPGLQGFVDRPLRDATGLSGNFEWQITTALPPGDPSDYPSLPTALEEQLGLKLEPRTAAVDVLAIDSLELPTPD
jgi:uncharacterized protein (TIGR03435 family)